MILLTRTSTIYQQGGKDTFTFSVIIPCFNCASLLPTAIDSVLKQTYKPYEIIVVNDGSTDNTLDLLTNYKDKIVVIDQKQAGPASARNKGISQATGELIAFLDADDTWEINKLQKAVEAFKNIDASMMFTNINYVNKEGTIVKTTNYPTLTTESIRRMLLWNCFIVLSSVVIKRDILISVGMFDTTLSYGEDWDLFYKIAREYQVTNCTDALTHYFLSDNSMMRRPGIRNKLIHDTLQVIERIYNYPENSHLLRKRDEKISDYFREFGESDLWYCNYTDAKTWLLKALNYNYFNTKAMFLLGKLLLKMSILKSKKS